MGNKRKPQGRQTNGAESEQTNNIVPCSDIIKEIRLIKAAMLQIMIRSERTI